MKTQKSYTVEEAQKHLEAYCAYQERCHKEVREKLAAMNMIPIAIDNIIAHLINENYLNETRFAKAFARGKFRIKKWGKIKITQQLKQRQISAYNIKVALNEISDNDYDKVLNDLIEKQITKIKESNTFKKKQKIVNYLLYRGWESHLVYNKLNNFL